MDARYEVAYREAVRTVDDQAKTLENIRARAGTLFSSAGVVAAVFGFAAGDRSAGEEIDRWVVVVAVNAFVVLPLTAVAIWWPTRRGQFRLGATKIIGDMIEDDDPLDLEGLYRDLALRHDQHAASNEEMIRGFFWCYVVGLVAFGVLVAALVVALSEVT